MILEYQGCQGYRAPQGNRDSPVNQVPWCLTRRRERGGTRDFPAPRESLAWTVCLVERETQVHRELGDLMVWRDQKVIAVGQVSAEDPE